MQLFSFLKKEFVKNVLTLFKGSVISQIVIYASILIITRLFSTEVFGVYMLFSSATLILKPLATMQYEFAIVLPKKKKDAINIFCLSFFVLLFFCLVLFVLIFFLKNEIAFFFNITSLKNFIYFLPLAIFLTGFISILEYWNNKTNFFKNISNGQVVKSITMSFSQIATGFSSYNFWGLIPGMLIGLAIQGIYLLKKSIHSISAYFNEISFKRMIFLMKKYKDIPIFNTAINVTNNLANEIPILLITKYFGLSTAGIFGLAIKFMKAPTNIIQNSINQVFFNKASKIFNEKGNLIKLVLKTSSSLFLIALIIFGGLFIISFYLETLFGSNWVNVGLYARILIPWLFFALISNPLTTLILILNKQKTILFFDIITLLFRFLAFYIGYHFYNDIIISLVLFSLVGVFFNIFLFFYLLKAAKTEKKAYL